MLQYKAIIFDLGNVVFNVDFKLIYKYWSEKSEVEFQKIKEYIELNKNFNLLERGDISEEQFRKETNEKLGMNLSDKDFDEGLCSLYLDLCEGIDELLDKLKQNYRVIALSNTNSIHKRAWSVKYKDTMRKFEKIFCSNELNTRKPEKEIYTIALSYLQLEPDEVIFLDDNEENIQAAKNLGIKTILVKSPEQMRNELEIILK